MNEKQLRNWLRGKLSDHHVHWVEPSRGSSVGLPDVFIPLPSGLLCPVELKVWKFVKPDSALIKMRPTQSVYHIKSEEYGTKTAFLVSVVESKAKYGKEIGKFLFSSPMIMSIYVNPLLENHVSLVEGQFVKKILDRDTGDGIISILCDDSFWQY